MNYIQLNITAKEEEQEQLISILSELSATGFEQTESNLLAYFEEENFPGSDVNNYLREYTFQKIIIKEQNWNQVWESNFQPVIVDNFCAIRADFHQPIMHVQHEIIITPKMSFGTGHHATTYMMIEHMQYINFTNKEVLDFGTGTGILAILAEKLGAAGIIAIDNDEWSFKNAKENTQKNSCTKIDVQLSSVLPGKKFDVILANINKNILLKYITYLESIVKENSILLLSGLLQDDKQDIIEAYTQNNFKLQSEKVRANWLSLLFINSK